MNTATIVVTVCILWLVMGIGFATAYADAKRKGKPILEAWTSYEGILFVVSIAVPILLLVIRMFR
ncbi:MAG: hypothetical protein LJE65_05470 [Desulfobacteraceae bacterium]|nr:hypothetical protein [Desulfobacteraceae bacterium]